MKVGDQGGVEARLNEFLQRVDDALHKGRRKRPWLAETIDVPISTVNTWFNDDRLPKTAEAVKIARALGTTVEYLVLGEGPARQNLPAETLEITQLMESMDSRQRAELLRFVRALMNTTGFARAEEVAGA